MAGGDGGFSSRIPYVGGNVERARAFSPLASAPVASPLLLRQCEETIEKLKREISRLKGDDVEPSLPLPPRRSIVVGADSDTETDDSDTEELFDVDASLDGGGGDDTDGEDVDSLLSEITDALTIKVRDGDTDKDVDDDDDDDYDQSLVDMVGGKNASRPFVLGGIATAARGGGN